MKLIGLDIGTTSICGVRMNVENGMLEDSVTVNDNVWVKGKSAFEKMQNPDKIFSIVNDITKRLITDDVGAIGVTGQMHGILYIDKKGNAISPLYTWQDGRGNEIYKDGITYAEFLNSHTGYGNVTHFYNEQNGLVPENAVCFCTIHDYIAMKLVGHTSPLVHTSDAASFGNFDIDKNEFTVNCKLLPNFTDRTAILGEYKGIPVSVAIGDNQAGFIGSGCGEDSVLFNVGTGSQISFLSDNSTMVSGVERRPLTDGKCLSVGSSLCGGRAFAMLQQFFNDIAKLAGADVGKMYDVMEQTAEEKGSTDLVFKTLFCGTRENPEKRAEILNLSEENFTPADFVLACLNGITDELFEYYNLCGKKATRLIGSGNAVRKTGLLRKSAEKRFGMPVQIPMFAEEAACGAALFSYAAIEEKDVLIICESVVKFNDLR